MAAAESMTGSEYVAHHLRHLASSTQNGLFDPSVLHYDTVAFSLLTAALVLIVMRLAAARATSGVPGRFQAMVEWAFQAVDEQAKAMVSVDSTYAEPVALWVVMRMIVMNAMGVVYVSVVQTVGR